MNDVLVGTPVPETDDRSSEEHYIAWELRIHWVGGVGVEHVCCTKSVVSCVADRLHGQPTCYDASVTKGRKTEEQHEERTYDEDRGLNG